MDNECVVKCKWCGCLTRETTLKECSNCWEIRSRSERNLHTAERIIRYIKQEKG